MPESDILADMSLGQLTVCRDIIGDTLNMLEQDTISKKQGAIAKALDDPIRREIQLFKAMKSAFAGQIDENVAHGPIISDFVEKGVKITPTGEYKIVQTRLNKMHASLRKVLGPEVGNKVAKIVEKTINRQWLATKSVMEKSLKRAGRAIDKGITRVDQGVINALNKQNNFFISEIYGKEHANLIGEVNAVTKKFVEQGLPKPVLTERIRETLTESLPPRADVYYKILANDVLNRARTFSQINAYVEARVRRYEIVAVMDERTSEVCEYMDGRVFEVETARKTVRDIRKVKIPRTEKAVDRFKALRPWVYLDDKAAKAGKDALFYRGPDGKKIFLPQSGFSGEARGEFKSKGVKTEEVNRQIEETAPRNANPPTLPPFHAHCRTTTVVDEADIKVQDWEELMA